MSGDFIWRDADRVVLLREDGIARAPQLLAEHGFGDFELLSTERALRSGEASALAESAAGVNDVPGGQVPQIAAELLEWVRAPRLVALGGGRVIDTAKAIASVSGAEVAAIPTTLSGAELTGIHRLPAGAENRVTGLVRPSLVIAVPEAMTGLPEERLRASAMNALAHGADSLYTPFANPVSRMCALRGAELIAGALDQDRGERDNPALAEGSLLCAYAIDSGLFAIHHVVCQTLVRVCGSPHAGTNAAILPRAMAFMAPRAPEAIADLASAIDTAAVRIDRPIGRVKRTAPVPGELDPRRIEARILELGGNLPGLGALGADRDRLPAALDAILARPELAHTPEAPDRRELEALIEAAW